MTQADSRENVSSSVVENSLSAIENPCSNKLVPAFYTFYVICSEVENSLKANKNCTLTHNQQPYKPTRDFWLLLVIKRFSTTLELTARAVKQKRIFETIKF